MKRFLTIACAFGLISLFASPSYAIDAKKKSGSATSSSVAPSDSSRSRSSVMQSKAASSKTLLERLKKDVRESAKSKDSEKYDNYIDKNNDGVDDRVKDRPASVETAKVKDSEAREKYSGTQVKQPVTQTDTSTSTAKKKKLPR